MGMVYLFVCVLKEDPLKVQMTQFAMSTTSVQDIALLDNKIYETVEQVNEWKTRRDFYLKFADNPQEFIQKWLVSQARDLRVRHADIIISHLSPISYVLQTMTETPGQPEAERKADYYYQPWLQESVWRYFYSKVRRNRLD